MKSTVKVRSNKTIKKTQTSPGKRFTNVKLFVREQVGALLITSANILVSRFFLTSLPRLFSPLPEEV